MERAAFEPPYPRGVQPDASRPGRQFRPAEEAAEQRAAMLAAAGTVADP